MRMANQGNKVVGQRRATIRVVKEALRIDLTVGNQLESVHAPEKGLERWTLTD